jgi:hypothetical protein
MITMRIVLGLCPVSAGASKEIREEEQPLNPLLKRRIPAEHAVSWAEDAEASGALLGWSSSGDLQ